MSMEYKIPIVIDYHHHNLNPGTLDIKILINKVLLVWKERDIKPKFHISECREEIGSLIKRRAHSDMITGSLEILKNHPKDVDLMIEAKLKEQSISYLRQNQFSLFSS